MLGHATPRGATPHRLLTMDTSSSAMRSDEAMRAAVTVSQLIAGELRDGADLAHVLHAVPRSARTALLATIELDMATLLDALGAAHAVQQATPPDPRPIV
jgi:hypothetical protein